jgi:hypothetical protein
VICRRAAVVITRSLDGPLPVRARIGLRVHTLFCSPCRRLQRQLVRLDAALRATVAAEGTHAPAVGGLSASARERIAAAVSRAVDGA